MKANRELKKWVFFSEDLEGRRCIFNERYCKSPSKTQDWAELQLHLDRPHIVSVGYQQVEEITLDQFADRMGINITHIK
jgi:hypothetical protein